MGVVTLDRALRFTCAACGGKWKAYEDAKYCHGVEPCTRLVDCKAISHFGDCKSTPSSPSYTLDELKTLMRKFLDDMQHRGHITTYGPDSLTDWKFETFLQWLAKRQQGEVSGR